MSRKKSRKTIRKAFNGVMKDAEGEVNVGKGQKQKIRIIDKVPLEQDEFTEHKELKVILSDFVMKAYDAQSHYQTKVIQMVKEVALSLEEKLIEMGKPQFICHISAELISILKQHKIQWKPIYIRRCLAEKYKDPTYRKIALARHEQRKKENAGVPINTGRTTEELEKELNNGQQIGTGEYIVSKTLNVVKTFDARNERKVQQDYKKWWAETVRKLVKNSVNEEDKTIQLTMSIPLIVKCIVKDRDAIVELDQEAFEKLSPMPKTKSKEEGKKKLLSEESEEKQRQVIGETLDMIRRGLGS